VTVEDQFEPHSERCIGYKTTTWNTSCLFWEQYKKTRNSVCGQNV